MSIEFKINQKFKELNLDLNDEVNTNTIRLINKMFREVDESHLYPINGEFNATDRAIRWYTRVYFRANGPCSSLEYILGLENKLREIVNKI